MFHNLPRGQNLQPSYTQAEIRAKLEELVSNLEGMGETIAAIDPNIREADIALFSHMAAGAILSIGELLGKEVAEELFIKKSDEMEAEIKESEMRAANKTNKPTEAGVIH